MSKKNEERVSVTKIKSTFDDINTVTTPKISLKKHQEILLDFIKKSKNKGILIFHSVGSGKTITSIMMLEYLYKKYPNKKIFILTPASLIGNYKKEMNKTGVYFGKNLQIQSYGIFFNKNIDTTGQIIVVDEAHNFNALDSFRSKSLEKTCEKAFKVILLTATPVKNSPDEITNLMKFISSDDKFKKHSFVNELNSILHLPDTDTKKQIQFNKLFKCSVSFFKNTDKTYYPTSQEYKVDLRMSISFYRKYYKIQENIIKDVPRAFDNAKDLIVFANGVRRAINKIDNENLKIDWSMTKILQDLKAGKKILFYSSFKDSGINVLKNKLNDKNIEFCEIHGDVSKKERDKQVDVYNSGIKKIMIITAAGSEGLDLKETRTVIILEPYWNYARIEQIIGRAVRYTSHSSLDVEKRHVDVYHLILQKPLLIPTLLNFDTQYSIDNVLYSLSRSKNIRISKFYDMLKNISIENDESCFK